MIERIAHAAVEIFLGVVIGLAVVFFVVLLTTP